MVLVSLVVVEDVEMQLSHMFGHSSSAFARIKATVEVQSATSTSAQMGSSFAPLHLVDVDVEVDVVVDVEVDVVVVDELASQLLHTALHFSKMAGFLQ